MAPVSTRATRCSAGNCRCRVPSRQAHWYTTLSRGYKAGGFNIGANVPEDVREFQPEYLWNLEAGVRLADAAARWQAELAVFHMWREEQQVAASFQLDPGDPLSYVFYTDNAASGRNLGLEASGSWQPLERLTLAASLGLLHTEYLDYAYGERTSTVASRPMRRATSIRCPRSGAARSAGWRARTLPASMPFTSIPATTSARRRIRCST